MCNKVELEKGERIEDLGCNNLKIIQNKDYYTFTCDSVILANFLKIKPREIAVEIGAGSGVVSILASAKNKPKKIVMFEIQEELQKLCEKNSEFRGFGQNCCVCFVIVDRKTEKIFFLQSQYIQRFFVKNFPK